MTNNNANNTINAAATTTANSSLMKKYQRQKIALLIATICTFITGFTFIGNLHIPEGALYASIAVGIGCYFAGGISGVFHFISAAFRTIGRIVPIFPINIIAYFTGFFLILMIVLFLPALGVAWSLDETRKVLKEAEL